MKKFAFTILMFFIAVSIGFSQSTSEEYGTKALDLFNKGDYNNAIKDASKAIELNSNNATAYLARGASKVKLNQYEAGILDINKAIVISPNWVWPHIYRALAYTALEKYDEAFADYEEAIRIDPNSLSAYVNRGHLKSELYRFQEAIDDYNLILEKDKNYTLAYQLKGFANENLGNYQIAISDYSKGILLDSKDPYKYYRRGECKYQLDQYTEAIKDFEKAIEFDTKYVWAYFSLGKCYLGLNMPSKANDNFNKVISLNVDTTYSYFAMSFLGQKELAITNMADMVNANPNKGNYYNLACMYALAGDAENSIKTLDLAIKNGYGNYYYFQRDKDFELIRYKPEYLALLEKYKIPNFNNDITLSKIITNEVRIGMMKWQEKGEFETSSAYIERMKTRDTALQKITLEVTNKLKVNELNKITLENATIGKYDSDGQTFMITFTGFSGIIMQIPIEDAPFFKSNFRDHEIVKKDMVISNEKWVISELWVTDTSKQKTFKYDIRNQPDYNPNKIFTLNFESLNLEIEQYKGTTSQKQSELVTISVGKDPVDIEIPVTGTNSSTTFALIIGNENYKNEITVPFALNDASIFAEYCKKTLGLPANNVHLVKDCTYGQMLGEIKWIQDVMSAYNGSAKVIFYYAGHGMPDEKDKSAYLLPVDGSSSIPATAVKADELYSNLSKIANSGIIIFLDACFSGGSRDGMLADGRGVKLKPKEEVLTGNIIVFSATSEDETALPIREKGHGLFTYYLLKMLQDSKGDVSLHELTEYVTTQVKQQSIVVNSKSQTPKVLVSPMVNDSWSNWRLK